MKNENKEIQTQRNNEINQKTKERKKKDRK